MAALSRRVNSSSIWPTVEIVNEQPLNSSMSGLITLSPNLSLHIRFCATTNVYTTPAAVAKSGHLQIVTDDGNCSFSVKAQPSGRRRQEDILSLNWSKDVSSTLDDVYAEIGSDTTREVGGGGGGGSGGGGGGRESTLDDVYAEIGNDTTREVGGGGGGRESNGMETHNSSAALFFLSEFFLASNFTVLPIPMRDGMIFHHHHYLLLYGTASTKTAQQ